MSNFPDNWQILPLEDCMSAIIDYRGKSPNKKTSGIPLITAKVVKAGRIEKTEEFIAEDEYKEWMQRGLPEPGDVVMTTEAPLGEIAQLDGQKVALAQRLITLRGKPQFLDNTYLKFLMQGEFVQDELKARATGTTVVGIRQSELRKVPLVIPPLTEQRAIAAVLGSLDDKIELNRRMNETLEALAQSLFKSWFVDATQSALPKGWREGTVGDLGDIICGKTPPTSDPENYGTDIPFVTIPDMHGQIFVIRTGKSLSQIGANTQPGKTLPPYSICVSCIATPGLVILTSQPCQTNQQINSVIPNAGYSPFYSYFALRELSDEIRSRGSGGSVTANLNKGDFAKIPISLPPVELSNRFQETTEPIFKKILANEHESRTLAALRDALLPKLLSGELRVPAKLGSLDL